jgi:Omp85 superfamily domain
MLLMGAAAAGADTKGQETSSAGPQNSNNQATSSPSPTANTDTKQAAKKKNKDQDATPKKPKRGQLVLAPIPITSPAVGSGLILVAGYVFKLNQDDKLSPPSTVGLAGAFTNSGSRGGGLGGRLYFGENKYQTTFVVAKGRVNYDFFGIGRLPNRPPVSVEIHQGGTVFFGEFLRNVGKDIFIGPRYQHRSLFARLGAERTVGSFEIPEIDIQAKTVAIGVHVQRDLRDNTFYPRKGSIFNWTGDFFDQAWGSKRQYQLYKLQYNNYHALGEKQVLAYRGMICSANQGVPFYDLCFFGVNNDLRGYTGGEFQNRRMFATQAEFRQELKGRFGVVAFGGVGAIARRWNEFRSDQLLPAAGAGLRFKLGKKNHINYRIDWAVGRAGHTLVIGIGEAF